ncbi:MAG: hypothetical protein ACI86H_002092, partial [bacterium]
WSPTKKQNLSEKELEELEKTKTHEKNAVTFLDFTCSWKLFENKILPKVEEIIKLEKKIRTPLIQRLVEISNLWNKSLETKARGYSLHEQVEADRWVWRSVYTITRMDGLSDQQKEEWKDFITGTQQNNTHGIEYRNIEILGLIARWSAYLTRAKSNNKKGA